MKKTVYALSLSVVLLMMFSLQGWSQSVPAEALKNVTIHTADGKTIDSGTIVWRKGIITDVGEDVNIPFDAYIYDGGDSLHIYPGFIDGLAHWGSPDVKENINTPEEPGDPSYERAGIQPQRQPSKLLESEKSFAKATKQGFTTAALGLKGQMLPGKVSLFLLGDKVTKDDLLYSEIATLAQFEEAQGQAYPSTIMGLMTQYRQLFNDAKALEEHEQYYASVSSNYPAPQKNEALEALFPVMNNDQPFYFVADTKENIERVLWLQDDLGFDVVIVSGKEAYKKADVLKKRGIPVLASVDLPEEPEWKTKKDEDEDQPEVSDEMRIFRDKQLEAYKADITNISKLIEAGVKVGYASNGLALKDLSKNLSTLQEEGELSEKQILQLLTQSTADILGHSERLGDLKSGRIANFTVFTESFLNEEAKAAYSVSNGEVTEFESESSEE